MRLLPSLALTCLAWPLYAAEPVLSRVTLSSGGVGQFEFTADVDGAETLPLDVPLDQVDDILKSLRVTDPAGLPNLRLPGREPLSESFRPLPFKPEAFASADALLGALIGEPVRLPGPGITGSILSVAAIETALPNSGGTLTRHRLTVATALGIESVTLEDAGAVEFTSEHLRSQVATALAAIAAARVQDRRSVQLGLAAGGARRVSFGFVTPVPVWKVSYRLIVPADGVDGPAQLQGFAVVENLSGRAWKDVEVVLTAGQPVLYHQPLYEAVFTRRPEAPVEVPNRLMPQLDQGSAAMNAAGTVIPVPSPAPMMAMPARAMAMRQQQAPAEAAQSVAQVAYRLAARVTAASGETSLLPIIDRPLPAKRVALYQPRTDRLHPLVALLLTNDAAGALPPGLVTLFERQADGSITFVGDARLPTIQPGEDRLASFAADLAVQVNVSQAQTSTILSARGARGVFEYDQRIRLTTTYRVTTPPGSGRTLLFDQLKYPEAVVVEPTVGVTATPSGYRIEQVVGAGRTEIFRVVEEVGQASRVVLSTAQEGFFAQWARQDDVPPAVKAAFQRLSQLRTDLDRKTDAVKALQARRTIIVTDQDRLRANLQAVPAQSELQRRYLVQMLQQETELSSLQAQEAAAQKLANDADAGLKEAILNFAT